MSRGRITPRRETPEKDAKPRRAEPVLVGHYFPGDRIETITIRGDNVGAQLMKIGLPRLAAFNALKAEVPQLLTGFELLEQKAHLIVDPQNQASFAQRFLTAARALDDDGAEALVEALGSPPWSPPPGGGPVPDDEAALADFRGRIAGLGTMSSVFRGAQRSIDAARVEVAHAASLLDLEARPVARGEMVERARTGLERLVGELQSRGNDLVAEVKVYASAWSSLDVFLRAAGKVVPRVHFINLPGGMAGIRSKSLEASFAGDAREIAQALEDLKVPWIDILPVEPVGDLAAFDVFSEHLDIFPTVYGTLLYNFNGYDGPAGLLKAAAETPPQGRVGHAHLAAIAGRGATNNGYPFALNVAAAGLRLVLDEVMGGPNEYGALTPLFGETDGRIYSGLGEVDTLGFSESTALQAAGAGVNVFASNAEGEVYLYETRSRSSLRGMDDFNISRFQTGMLGQLATFFRRGPGRMNMPKQRRELARTAHAVYAKPYEKVFEGQLKIVITPEPTNDPRGVRMLIDSQVPQSISSIEVVSKAPTPLPTSP